MVVEAKADEPFSKEVCDILNAAIERRIKSARSNGLARVDQLARSLFSPRAKSLPSIGSLRYQLLTATAAALAEAERQGVGRAILVVQEFVTAKTADQNHERNADDLLRFLRRLSGSTQAVFAAGQLHGPFQVPGPPLFASGAVDLFVGKARRNVR